MTDTTGAAIAHDYAHHACADDCAQAIDDAIAQAVERERQRFAAMLNDSGVKEQVARALEESESGDDGRYSCRRTMDKKGCEVVEWPDPDIAANDKRLAVFSEMVDAALYIMELKRQNAAQAALDTLKRISQDPTP